jgi:hypothetical protein
MTKVLDAHYSLMVVISTQRAGSAMSVDDL